MSGVPAIIQWMQNSDIGTGIRESIWLFPIVEATHVLALAFSVGVLVWFDLRLMGVNMKHRPVSEVFHGVYWWMIGGFTTAIISGLLLFWAEADRASPSFWDLFARIRKRKKHTVRH